MERIKKEVVELLPYLLILIVVILIKHFLATPIIVHGDSMNPTLKNRDIMILNKISLKTSKISRGDIVVIKFGGETLIKRVIGLPGENIRCEDHKIYINDKILDDEFSDETDDFLNTTLLEDEYYVLGDNRSNSVDSRIIGPVNKKYITGKASLTIFPFNRFGTK